MGLHRVWLDCYILCANEYFEVFQEKEIVRVELVHAGSGGSTCCKRGIYG